jgi:hypothetical protein
VGLRARRLAVLTCLLVPSAVRAQLAPVGVPAGVVRVDLDGALDTWDHRWLEGQREPLATDMTTAALGQDVLPELADADARIERITGLSGYRLNLGVLTTDAQSENNRGFLGLALGLTRTITIFGRMPLVEVRTDIHYDLQPSTTDDAGVNSADLSQATFFQEFDASLTSLSDRIAAGDFDGDPALKTRAQSTLDAGTALRNDLFGLLSDPTTASPFVPIATSTALSG